ncbi:MAG: type II toxin-antitoxin system mRNA interferase toxin, RelE/StbE family [Candidatus Omnitrophota bacterium]|nr:MAG: type II toxin-antitoxin system mRNA interferase toxin, RelE/StbE family [Candidatus Omnitrophota bacterium]
MEITLSSSFKRSFKKQQKNKPEREYLFWEKVEIFVNNPFDKQLKTHKLSGELKELWSFTIEYDLRVLFYFVEENKAVFVDIGKHDEVY